MSRRRARVIDVSIANRPGMPCYPDDPRVTVERVRRLEAGDPYALVALGLGNHTGTHVDAPAHVVPGGATLGALGLEGLVGEAVVADLRGRSVVDADALAPVRLAPGDILLCRTDNSDWWDAPSAGRAPVVMTEDAARLVVARRVRTVGFDALSIETPDERLPVHRLLLGSGVLVVEGLDLRPAPSGRCTFVCLPLKFPDLDGAPARAVLLA
jgi:arylformamidase